MRILQINCVYGEGSTGKITSCLHNALTENKVESFVVYGRGKNVSVENVYKIGNDALSKVSHACSRFSGDLYGGCYLQTKSLLREIASIHPDVVHLQCINGFFVNIYNFLGYLAKNKIPTVLTLHAEFMYTGSCGYALDCDKWSQEQGCHDCFQWKEETRALIGDRTHKSWRKMYEAFQKFSPELIRIVSVSPWLQSRAEKSTILKSFEHSTIFNGVNTEIFNCSGQRNTEKRNKEEMIIFHATAFFSSDEKHIKGGYYLLKLAEKMNCSKVKFVVAGEYEQGISVPNNVILLGRITDQRKLASYYSQADLTVLTSRRETFSMVCAESLCCGTPVIGFYAGAPETIAIKDFSQFVPFGDIDAMEEAIEKFMQKKLNKAEVSKAACNVYSEATMMEAYNEMYRELLGDK